MGELERLQAENAMLRREAQALCDAWNEHADRDGYFVEKRDGEVTYSEAEFTYALARYMSVVGLVPDPEDASTQWPRSVIWRAEREVPGHEPGAHLVDWNSGGLEPARVENRVLWRETRWLHDAYREFGERGGAAYSAIREVDPDSPTGWSAWVGEDEEMNAALLRFFDALGFSTCSLSALRKLDDAYVKFREEGGLLSYQGELPEDGGFDAELEDFFAGFPRAHAARRAMSDWDEGTTDDTSSTLSDTEEKHDHRA